MPVTISACRKFRFTFFLELGKLPSYFLKLPKN